MNRFERILYRLAMSGHYATECRVVADASPCGNKRARLARLRRVSLRMNFGGWKCAHCGDPVPEYRRADARYYCTSCRKAAHRDRAAYRAERLIADFCGDEGEYLTEINSIELVEHT